MKPVSFELVRASTLAQACAALADPDARPLAGGQSLGPMLNFRLVRPATLVQINHLVELSGVTEDAESVTIGACVTHAAIADGRTPDIGRNILAHIAEGIAYRAVRNRGTIGGSLCHADPAADWVTTLIALDATALVHGADDLRAVPLERFFLGAFRTALAPGEILQAIRIPRLAKTSGWGYVKACRKPGEFAHAMAAVLVRGGAVRAVIGATGNIPLLLRSTDDADAALARVLPDPITRQMQLVCLQRARAEASA
jgi:carbon-monoxide dehydrogenase medium subunit